jgi:hypothetical protein
MPPVFAFKRAVLLGGAIVHSYEAQIQGLLDPVSPVMLGYRFSQLQQRFGCQTPFQRLLGLIDSIRGLKVMRRCRTVKAGAKEPKPGSASLIYSTECGLCRHLYLL